MNLLRLVKPVKDLVVPDETRPRTIRAGLCKGLRMELNPRHDLWVQLGLYELEIRDHVRRAVKRGDTCYDIGAASGYYALAMARLAEPGVVVAMEPDGERRDRLARNLLHNPIDGSEVVVRDDLVGTGEDSASIDRLVFDEDLPAPDVIKMDIEGAEGDALRGAERTLAEHRPRCIIETHSARLERDCVHLLSAADYEIQIIAPDTRWVRDEPKLHRRWLVAYPGP